MQTMKRKKLLKTDLHFSKHQKQKRSPLVPVYRQADSFNLQRLISCFLYLVLYVNNDILLPANATV